MIVTRDLPGRKRILMMNMRPQRITFNKAVKGTFEMILFVTFRHVVPYIFLATRILCR